MINPRLLVASCVLLSTACSVTRPYELLQLTRSQPTEYFGQLYPGITDSKDLENEPFARPFKPRSASGLVPEYNSGSHPALAFATYQDGQYCFDYRTLQPMKSAAEEVAARFNSQYSLVIRTHRTLEEITEAEEWPQAQPTHTSTLIDQPHYLLTRPAAQGPGPENVLHVCQAGPRLEADTKFLTVTLVSSRNWRNNALLIWDFQGKKQN